MNSQKFKQIAHMKQGFAYGANTKTLLIRASHYAFQKFIKCLSSNPENSSDLSFVN